MLVLYLQSPWLEMLTRGHCNLVQSPLCCVLSQHPSSPSPCRAACKVQREGSNFSESSFLATHDKVLVPTERHFLWPVFSPCSPSPHKVPFPSANQAFLAVTARKPLMHTCSRDPVQCRHHGGGGAGTAAFEQSSACVGRGFHREEAGTVTQKLLERICHECRVCAGGRQKEWSGR